MEIDRLAFVSDNAYTSVALKKDSTLVFNYINQYTSVMWISLIISHMVMIDCIDDECLNQDLVSGRGVVIGLQVYSCVDDY